MYSLTMNVRESQAAVGTAAGLGADSKWCQHTRLDEIHYRQVLFFKEAHDLLDPQLGRTLPLHLCYLRSLANLVPFVIFRASSNCAIC